MTSKYTPPRSAQDSEEKKRREEGQNYDRRPTPPPVMHRKPTVDIYKFKKDGYDFHEFNTPVRPETFHKITKGKYKKPRSA